MSEDFPKEPGPPITDFQSAPAAFRATFSSLRSLTDGDYRISFDFPSGQFIEVAQILAQGGMPSAAKGDWFAIARLNLNRGDTANCGDSLKSGSRLLISETPNTEGAARNQLAMRAALLCNDPQFRLFLERTYLPKNNHCNSEADAAEIVRHLCDVKSRADIVLGTAAADKFDRLVGNFTVWKHADKYVETP